MLFKSIVKYVVGEFFSKAFPFLLLPYFALKLGADGVGELTLFQGYCALFLVLINAGLDTCLNRYYYRYGARSYNLLFLLSLLYSLSISFIILIFILIYNSQGYISLALLVSYLTTVSNVFLSNLQIRGKVNFYIFSQILNSLCATFFTILFFEFYSPSVFNRAVSIAVGFVFSMSFLIYCVKFDFRIIKKIKKNFNDCRLLFCYLLSFSLPLVVNNFANFSRTYLDKFLIDSYYSQVELGIYAIAFQISAVIVVFLLAVNKAVQPLMFKLLKDGVISGWPPKNYLFLYFIFIFISVFLIKSTPNSLLVFIFGDEFSGVITYLQPMILYSLSQVLYLYMANVLIFNGKTRTVSEATLLGLFFQCIYLYFSIQESIYMVSYSSLFSSVVTILYMLYKVSKRG